MDNIRYLIAMWAAALLFIAIGIYASSRKTPMWFWTGYSIPTDKVTDLKAYNRAVGKMWCLFSIPLWISGIIELFLPEMSIIIFAFNCSICIGGPVWYYHKIEEKYIIK